MSPTPVLTLGGAAALLAAQGGGAAVVLTRIMLGSAARLPTGEETALVNVFASGPIQSHTMAVAAGQLDLGFQIDGADTGLTEARAVREIGVFDQLDRLIFYWATAGDGLGSLTPATAYALSIALTLAPADAEVIQIIDQGPPWGALFEARLTAATRAAWRNLFLAQS